MSGGIEALGELVEMMAGRGHFYRLLARVFAQEIDAQFLTALRERQELLGAMRELSRRGQEQLVQFLRRTDIEAGGTTTDEVVVKLAVEYTALFLGAGSSAAKSVLPYASAYLSANKSLMQEPYARIRDFFGRAGFMRTEQSRELDDHVSIVLEFVSRMADATGDALAASDIPTAQAKLRLQREFLDHHVLTWVPTFCRVVGRRDATGFYRGFALITAGFLRTDGGMVDEVIEELSINLGA